MTFFLAESSLDLGDGGGVSLTVVEIDLPFTMRFFVARVSVVGSDGGFLPTVAELALALAFALPRFL